MAKANYLDTVLLMKVLMLESEGQTSKVKDVQIETKVEKKETGSKTISAYQRPQSAVSHSSAIVLRGGLSRSLFLSCEGFPLYSEKLSAFERESVSK